MTTRRRPSRFLQPGIRTPESKSQPAPRAPAPSRFLDPAYQPPAAGPSDYQLDNPAYILGLIQQSELLIQQLQLHLDHLHRQRPPQAAPPPPPPRQP